MISTNEVTFVYLGETLPRYARSSLCLAVKYGGLQVRLIGNSALERDIPDEDIIFTTVESFYDTAEFAQAAKNLLYPHTFRGGFWLKSLERLFVLEQFMRFRNLDSIFHSELDQLLFRVDLLTSKLDGKREKGVFLPFDRETAALASVFYCNDRNAFRSLIDFANQGGLFHNEMALLANWARESPNLVFALPTIDGLLVKDSPHSPSKVKTLDVDDIGGIVDAARLGQWVGGIDPRNVPIRERPTTKFVDAALGSELLVSQLQRSTFRFTPSEGILQCNYGDLLKVNVYNLHIHSKIHSWLLRSDSEFSRFFEQANQSHAVVLPGTRLVQIDHVVRHRLTQVIESPQMIGSEIRRRMNYKLNRRPKSDPFISGDTFRALADHVWESQNERINPNSIKAGDVVFCESESVQGFRTNILNGLHLSIVLLLGNSDQNNTDSLGSLLETGNIEAIFAQNLIEPVPGTEPLPIGLENAWRGNHGRTSSFRRARRKPKSRLFRLMWTFSVSTNLAVRTEAVNVLTRAEVADHLGRLSPRQHRNALMNYAFVASPPGNGLDTHRTWEAMYLGCVPLVLRSHMTEFYESLGLPIWIVDSYDNLSEMTESYLQIKYEELQPKFDSLALWTEFWADRIRVKSESAKRR